jgi:putative tryptophan/tyrosine transport system substrate-binding protein
VNRRKFLALGTVALPAAALPAWAQRRTLPRIGFLSLIALEADTRVPSFVAGLKEFGYVEGKTVAIEWRSAGGDAKRLAGFAQELVRMKVDVIVAVQTQAIEEARRATRTIPIVFAATQDPVGSGYAKSLSRPGGNITGVSSLSAEMSPKQLQLLRSVVPRLTRVALLANPTNSASQAIRTEIQQTAASLGIQITPVGAGKPDEIEPAIATAAAAKSDAVMVLGDSFFVQMRTPIAQAALRHRLPTIFVPRDHVVAGGLMSYGPSIAENYRRTAFYIDRILKGTEPGDLPIEQPSKFELVLNLRTAKTLDLAIGDAVLARFDEIIK